MTNAYSIIAYQLDRIASLCDTLSLDDECDTFRGLSMMFGDNAVDGDVLDLAHRTATRASLLADKRKNAVSAVTVKLLKESAVVLQGMVIACKAVQGL